MAPEDVRAWSAAIEIMVPKPVRRWGDAVKAVAPKPALDTAGVEKKGLVPGEVRAWSVADEASEALKPVLRGDLAVMETVRAWNVANEVSEARKPVRRGDIVVMETVRAWNVANEVSEARKPVRRGDIVVMEMVRAWNVANEVSEAPKPVSRWDGSKASGWDRNTISAVRNPDRMVNVAIVADLVVDRSKAKALDRECLLDLRRVAIEAKGNRLIYCAPYSFGERLAISGKLFGTVPFSSAFPAG